MKKKEKEIKVKMSELYKLAKPFNELHNTFKKFKRAKANHSEAFQDYLNHSKNCRHFLCRFGFKNCPEILEIHAREKRTLNEMRKQDKKIIGLVWKITETTRLFLLRKCKE